MYFGQMRRDNVMRLTKFSLQGVPCMIIQITSVAHSIDCSFSLANQKGFQVTHLFVLADVNTVNCSQKHSTPLCPIQKVTVKISELQLGQASLTACCRWGTKCKIFYWRRHLWAYNNSTVIVLVIIAKTSNRRTFNLRILLERIFVIFVGTALLSIVL